MLQISKYETISSYNTLLSQQHISKIKYYFALPYPHYNESKIKSEELKNIIQNLKQNETKQKPTIKVLYITSLIFNNVSSNKVSQKVSGMTSHLSLDSRGCCVQQREEILEQSELLSQILPAHIGAAQRQDHREQFKAVSIRGGIFVIGLRIGIFFA